MLCPFCKVSVTQWDEPRSGHLIVTKNSKDNHFHTHGELTNKDLVRELIDAATLEANIVKQSEKLDKKEIVFANRQRIGDILCMTAAIRDFKAIFPDVRVNVATTAMHIWDNNPFIDSSLTPTEENTLRVGPSKLTNSSNRLDWHFTNAYRISIEDALNIHIQQGISRPDIWFTEEEYNAERITKEPYWIIITSGEKGWGCKMYSFERWQEFINQNQDKLFYQLGASEEKIPRLQGKNVVDYVGKTQDRNTGIRDLFKLFLNAEGSIGLVSFHMHLSGALYKPTIVIAGAREPVSFTRYQGQQYIATEGCLQCAATTACWHCDIDACTDLVVKKEEKIPRCVDMIQPDDITRAINNYYIGGRLNLKVASQKPKLKNIVKTPIKIVISEIKREINKYPLEFGNDSLTERDWEFIQNTISKYQIKTALEFGAGLSTLLLNDKINRVVTFEDNQSLLSKIKELKPKADIRLWDTKSIDLKEKFDFAFIDSPVGGKNREFSTQIAAQLADIVIVHDAGREYEKIWQNKYIEVDFMGPEKGGHRCSLWLRKSKFEAQTCSKMSIVESISEIEHKSDDKSSNLAISMQSKKFIRFVFNGRGEGGAERSVVWMMNKLVESGHRIIYHTPNSQPCGTFRNTGNKDIKVEDCNSLHEVCDILVFYTNDWIWNFYKNEICDIFSNINAQKKVLCVNYKIDKIGLIPWTKDWDLYLFLNSTFEKTLLERCPNAKTKVLAPPTDLTKFFEVKPDYSNGLKLIRHSSQGDIKYPKNFNEIVEQILKIRDDISIRLMPAPSFLTNFNGKVITHQRNKPSIDEFLKLGNCFWYKLPDDGYTEGGPRVIMEAQASGLSVIADNHSGMKNRIIEKTGWLVNSIEEHLNVIKNISSEELEEYGKNAREHARISYDPMNWINNILDNI